MGKGSKPQMPDMSTMLAEQQRVSNEQMWNSLRASRPNMSNPYGTSTWTHTPRFDQAGYDRAMADWQARQPAARAPTTGGALDYDSFIEGSTNNPQSSNTAAVGMMPTRDQFTTYDATNRVAFSGPMARQWRDVGGKMRQTIAAMNPNASVDLIDDVGGLYSQDLADAIYRRTTRLSDDQFNQARTGLENRLAERGFQVGNEGYNAEMDRFQRGMSEHYSDAADRAQIQAAQQALAEGGFTNNARLSEFATNEGHKLALAQALSGIQSQMSAGLYGGFAPVSPVGSPSIDVAGLYGQQYNAAMDAYNAEVGESNALMGAALTAASLFFPPAALATPLVMGQPGSYANPPNLSMVNVPGSNGGGYGAMPSYNMSNSAVNSLYIPPTRRA